jgi:cytochrome c-type biogenesis protein CcmE
MPCIAQVASVLKPETLQARSVIAKHDEELPATGGFVRDAYR